MRRLSREIKLGSLNIGGSAPISVQSMTNTDTQDVEATIAQAHKLEAAGCEVIRVAVPNVMAASMLGSIKSGLSVGRHIPIRTPYDGPTSRQCGNG